MFQLFKLQQRFKGDERFKLDERFAEQPDAVDEVVETSIEDVVQQQRQHSEEGPSDDEEVDLEKEKEMNISVLEQVLGKPLNNEKKNKRWHIPQQFICSHKKFCAFP